MAKASRALRALASGEVNRVNLGRCGVVKVLVEALELHGRCTSSPGVVSEILGAMGTICVGNIDNVSRGIRVDGHVVVGKVLRVFGREIVENGDGKGGVGHGLDELMLNGMVVLGVLAVCGPDTPDLFVVGGVVLEVLKLGVEGLVSVDVVVAVLSVFGNVGDTWEKDGNGFGVLNGTVEVVVEVWERFAVNCNVCRAACWAIVALCGGRWERMYIEGKEKEIVRKLVGKCRKLGMSFSGLDAVDQLLEEEKLVENIACGVSGQSVEKSLPLPPASTVPTAREITGKRKKPTEPETHEGQRSAPKRARLTPKNGNKGKKGKVASKESKRSKVISEKPKKPKATTAKRPKPISTKAKTTKKTRSTIKRYPKRSRQTANETILSLEEDNPALPTDVEAIQSKVVAVQKEVEAVETKSAITEEEIGIGNSSAPPSLETLENAIEESRKTNPDKKATSEQECAEDTKAHDCHDDVPLCDYQNYILQGRETSDESELILEPCADISEPNISARDNSAEDNQETGILQEQGLREGEQVKHESSNEEHTAVDDVAHEEQLSAIQDCPVAETQSEAAGNFNEVTKQDNRNAFGMDIFTCRYEPPSPIPENDDTINSTMEKECELVCRQRNPASQTEPEFGSAHEEHGLARMDHLPSHEAFCVEEGENNPIMGLAEMCGEIEPIASSVKNDPSYAVQFAQNLNKLNEERLQSPFGIVGADIYKNDTQESTPERLQYPTQRQEERSEIITVSDDEERAAFVIPFSLRKPTNKKIELEIGGLPCAKRKVQRRLIDDEILSDTASMGTKEVVYLEAPIRSSKRLARKFASKRKLIS